MPTILLLTISPGRSLVWGTLQNLDSHWGELLSPRCFWWQTLDISWSSILYDKSCPHVEILVQRWEDVYYESSCAINDSMVCLDCIHSILSIYLSSQKHGFQQMSLLLFIQLLPSLAQLPSISQADWIGPQMPGASGGNLWKLHQSHRSESRGGDRGRLDTQMFWNNVDLMRSFETTQPQKCCESPSKTKVVISGLHDRSFAVCPKDTFDDAADSKTGMGFCWTLLVITHVVDDASPQKIVCATRAVHVQRNCMQLQCIIVRWCVVNSIHFISHHVISYQVIFCNIII